MAGGRRRCRRKRKWAVIWGETTAAEVGIRKKRQERTAVLAVQDLGEAVAVAKEAVGGGRGGWRAWTLGKGGALATEPNMMSWHYFKSLLN